MNSTDAAGSSSSPLIGGRSEAWIIAVIGAVQFINIVDFMMVMPLGPDFAQGLGIDVSHLGVIGGAYTGAAAVSGVVGAFFLDRFERRRVLTFCAVGLSLGTLSGAFAWDLNSLIAARVLAGLFGGPATSIALAIIADVIPAERRGRAMGAVMGAFSAASVLGVPAGLQLATWGGWRLPFFAVAAVGLVVAALGRVFLPRLTLHLERGPPLAQMDQLRGLTADRDVLLAYTLVALTHFGGFLLIPNFSAHIQHNLGYPRSGLGFLYFVGGALSFFVLRIAGRFVDRLGSARVVAVGSVGVTLVLLGFVIYPGSMPVTVPAVVYFALFMCFQSSRNVSQQTLLTKVPPLPLRAGFMSFMSAVQHGAAALGAMSGSLFLHEKDGRLLGMGTIGFITIALNTSCLPLVFWLEARVKARAKATTPPEPSLLSASVAHVPEAGHR